MLSFTFCSYSNHERSRKHRENVALLKEVMAEEEERSEVKGHASSGSLTLSSDDHSQGEEDIDTNMAAAGVEGGEGIVLGGGGERESTPAASDASSSSDDADDIALSSLVRCVSIYYYFRLDNVQQNNDFMLDSIRQNNINIIIRSGCDYLFILIGTRQSLAVAHLTTPPSNVMMPHLLLPL